jgi:hypothetical protein
VQVLDQKADRPVLGQTRHEDPDDLEDAVLERFGRQLRQALLRLGLERQPEQRPQVRVALVHAVAEQALDLAPEPEADAELRVVRRCAEPGPHEVAERPVRHRLAVGDAPALEPERPAVPGR